MSVPSLESKVNAFLHANAAHRLVNEQCGPFHIGFDADDPLVWLRERFRRRGIGAAVTAALTRAAFDDGLECVWLSPAGPDQERLYASIGYRSCGEMLFIWKQ